MTDDDQRDVDELAKRILGLVTTEQRPLMHIVKASLRVASECAVFAGLGRFTLYLNLAEQFQHAKRNLPRRLAQRLDEAKAGKKVPPQPL